MSPGSKRQFFAGPAVAPPLGQSWALERLVSRRLTQSTLSTLFSPKFVKLAEELNASVEYFMDNNNISLHMLSQSTVQPLLWSPQYAAEERFCKHDVSCDLSTCLLGKLLWWTECLQRPRTKH